MTRTPRAPESLRTLTSNLRSRVPAGLSRKTVAYAGAGLALAGAGAATMSAGFAAHPASAAGPQYKVSRSVDAAPGQHAVAGHSAAPGKAAQVKVHPGKTATPAKQATPAKHTASRTAPAKRATQAGHHAAPAPHAATWATVSRVVADRTYPKAGHGTLPAQDQLTPVGTSGPQTWMPITAARWDNAKTIVQQAIARHMGLRAAVIAVATSMQESTLLNLNYGDRDSLGLFQQRPSCGWGTPAQIQHPAYAADAFLKALHGYQVRNPDWAHQPLWQAAQGIQGSAFPSAYAKWEAQAAHLVASVAPHIV